MVRSPCCDNKLGLKKGSWTPEEDRILLAYIQQHGHGSWRSLPSKAGLERCGKSCRLRWANYLRPDIKRGKFSFQEEQSIIQLHALLGNRWSSIATHLPKRTDNEIKNYWNTRLKKKLTLMGIDPVTHKPKDNLALNICESKYAANISHMAQWESARLQAEARLVRQSNLSHHPHLLNAATAPLPCLDILKVWEWTNPGKDISSMVLDGPQNMDENSYITSVDSSVGNCNEARGIIENSMEHAYDSSGFPSFDHLPASGTSNNAPRSCWGVLEENSWNVPTSPTGSPMF